MWEKKLREISLQSWDKDFLDGALRAWTIKGKKHDKIRGSLKLKTSAFIKISLRKQKVYHSWETVFVITYTDNW